MEGSRVSNWSPPPTLSSIIQNSLSSLSSTCSKEKRSMLSFFQNTLPLSLAPKHPTAAGRPPSSKALPPARYLRLRYRLQESLPRSQKPPPVAFRAQIRRLRHATGTTPPLSPSGTTPSLSPLEAPTGRIRSSYPPSARRLRLRLHTLLSILFALLFEFGGKARRKMSRARKCQAWGLSTRRDPRGGGNDVETL
ncbi:hypothetical protein BT93_I0504 [Corymbia citriodora subsp. variegata]|nr:hypothetical protein BT93_I0504 [Corymbia citriodora subsp. variegata]